MEKGRNGEIYHLSPDKGITIRELVKLISNKMDVSFTEVTRDVGERLGQDAAYVIDSSKARNELNWKPVVVLENGIEETIKWIEDGWDKINNIPIEYKHKA